MRTTSMLAAVAAVFGLTLVASAQRANEAERLLGQGLHFEEVEDDCKEAIKAYERVLQQRDASRNVAARAQLHLGVCQEKLGRQQARAAYEKVVSGFQDQQEIVAIARARLEAGDATSAPVRVASSGIHVAGVDPTSGNIHGPATRITQDPRYWDQAIAWSPDGRLMALKRRLLADSQMGDVYSLLVRSLETGEETVLLDGRKGGGGTVTWFGDSRSVLGFGPPRSFRRIDTRTGEIAVLGPADPILEGLASVRIALSADDKTVYAGRLRDGTIVAFDTVTQRQRVFAVPGEEGTVALSMSPDGSTLLLARGGDPTTLAIVEASGSNYRELFKGSLGWIQDFGGMKWSRDSRSVFFGRTSGGDIWEVMKVSVDGGQPVSSGLMVLGLRAFDFSPDGRRFAFTGTGFSIAGERPR